MRPIAFKVGKLDLPSGLRIVIQEDHSQPLVAVVVVVDAGASQDPPGKEGLAHLVEHLTFRARPDGKIQRSNLLDFAGAGTWNDYTGHDQTTFVTLGPKEAFKPFLAIEWSRLLKPLAGIDARTFEAEKGVVLNEIAQSDEDGRISAVDQRLYAALYPEGHPYHRMISGTTASVSTLTLADAEAFVQKNHLLRNVTLYIARRRRLARRRSLSKDGRPGAQRRSRRGCGGAQIHPTLRSCRSAASQWIRLFLFRVECRSSSLRR